MCIRDSIDGGYLFTPVIIMMITQFISGLICVTSFNIRISSTQNYVPNEMRGRYNGTYQMLTTVGSIIGQLSAGWLGEVFPVSYTHLQSTAVRIAS